MDLEKEIFETSSALLAHGLDTYLMSKGISREEWRLHTARASMVPFEGVAQTQLELLMGIAMMIGERNAR